MVAAQQHLSLSDSSRLFEGPHTIKPTTVVLAVAAVAEAEAATATAAESTKCVTGKCFTFPVDAVEPSERVATTSTPASTATAVATKAGNLTRRQQQ